MDHFLQDQLIRGDERIIFILMLDYLLKDINILLL